MSSERRTPTFHYRFHQVALATVGIGATIGILAAFAVWIARGNFPETTFSASAFALFAAWPVWRDYRRMRAET